MNKLIQSLNIAGVLALAVLCCFQWRENSRQIRGIDALERMRVEQTNKIAEQDRAIQNFENNLEDLRDRLTISLSALKESQDKVTSLTAERNQLKTELGRWTAAVADRDEIIKQQAAQAKKLLDDRNEIVDKYNALVKTVNDAQSKP